MKKRKISLIDGVLTVKTDANDKQWRIVTNYIEENTNGTIREAREFLKDIPPLKIKFI